jgi:hypothetical protein
MQSVTGEPHIVKVRLPHGFEYREAEFITGKARPGSPIELTLDGTHAHIAKVHWSTASWRAEQRRYPLETLLRRDRLVVARPTPLSFCRGRLVPMARDMYGSMSGAAAWMMTSEWGLVPAAAMVGMWAAMMLG